MNNKDKLCLKWNEFETNIRDSFRELREEKNHFDVTLASDDGHQIEAHRMILSSGSQFLKNVLKKIKHPCPFIYLKGVRGIELEYVVNFLYNAETFVALEDLGQFLEIAQDLEINGIFFIVFHLIRPR